MNPLTQFKKIRILPLLIAPALVTLTAAPALATPNCGVVTDNLLYPGQPVDTAHAANFQSGSLKLMFRRNLPDWMLRRRVSADSGIEVLHHECQHEVESMHRHNRRNTRGTMEARR